MTFLPDTFWPSLLQYIEDVQYFAINLLLEHLKLAVARHAVHCQATVNLHFAAYARVECPLDPCRLRILVRSISHNFIGTASQLGRFGYSINATSAEIHTHVMCMCMSRI